jgi:hypothetical protein
LAGAAAGGVRRSVAVFMGLTRVRQLNKTSLHPR